MIDPVFRLAFYRYSLIAVLTFALLFLSSCKSQTDQDLPYSEVDLLTESKKISDEETGQSEPNGFDKTRSDAGRSYVAQCLSCHGDDGKRALSKPEDSIIGNNNLLNCDYWSCQSRSDLAAYIEKTMPFGRPDDCINDCAVFTANYIYDSLAREQTIPEEQDISAELEKLPNIYTPMRRLSYREYDKTLNRLLQVSPKSHLLPAETSIDGYTEEASAQPSSDSLTYAYYQAAQESIREYGDVTNLPNCDGDTLTNQCVRDWIGSFGFWVFRRPLSEEEKNDYWVLYENVASNSNSRLALETVITTFLISPNFLYLIEKGVSAPERDSFNMEEGETSEVFLTSYELANRLSYLLLDENPDHVLYELARDNSLRNPEVLSEQFDRLMGLAKNRQSFYGGDSISGIEERLKFWFEIKTADDITSTFNLSAQESDAILNEIEEYLHRWFFNGADFGSLYTSVVDVALSQSASNLDSSMNVGVLGLQGFLLSHGKPGTPMPITRGVFAVEKLLCNELGAPPADLVIEVPTRGDKTEREWLIEHSNSPSCAACHQKIDNYGIVFDEFDLYGRYRTEESSGIPIDPSANLVEIGDVSGLYNSLYDFAQTLALSNTALQCHARTWYRGSFSREIEEGYDEAYLDLLIDHWQEEGGSASTILKAIVMSPLFSRRVVD